ncbi:MAG: hypothetical protein HY673_20630, partial [Chloroflexi bacterium]|nr:hypothetical protein [Chloroflexota bacterium]
DHGMPVYLESSLKGILVSNATYNALGRMVSLSLGNGLTTNYQYFGVEYTGQGNVRYGLLRSIVTGGLQSLTYDYDAKGNVSQIVDNNGHGNETVDFTYDHLDRLTNTANAFVETYQYNSIGNMTSKNGVSRTFPAAGQPRPHAPTVVGADPYTYNEVGNLVSAEGRSYGYDVENRLVSAGAVGSLPARSFLYDGDGILRRTDVGVTPTTRYVTGDYEIDIQTGEATCYRRNCLPMSWRD